MVKSISRKRKRQFYGNKFKNTSKKNRTSALPECTASCSKLVNESLSTAEEMPGPVFDNRIVDLELIVEAFAQLCCPKCFTEKVELFEDSRYGLCSHFTLNCKLTDNFIDRLQNYYGIAVRSNLNVMQQNVIAALYHCASSDKKPMHGQCPIGKKSWCCFQRGVANGTKCSTKYAGLSNDVLNKIKPVYLEICDKQILKATSDSKVRKWARKFKDGRTNVHDEECSGRPSVITDDLMQTVETKIRENRRFTITTLSLEFPDVFRLVVYKIMTEDLNFKNCFLGRYPVYLQRNAKRRGLPFLLTF
ncbi:uncharacterized protein TNCV_3056371 [Trichonephila clavipes]|nr:uncharacterized protein TNCV_3056371 [Trichonephila clavipes]